MVKVGEETGRRRAYLDGWRGCAIAAVLVGHFLLSDIFPGVGTFGVQLFFVLSGTLMAEILFLRRAELTRFYVRRFSRVYPALLVFVSASAGFFMNAGGGYPVGIKGVVSALTFSTNYAMYYSHAILLFDHLWSLCVEEHAYIVLSLIALASRKLETSVTFVLGCIWFMATVNGVVRVDVLGQDKLHVLWRSDVSIAMIASAAWMRMLLPGSRSSPYFCSMAFLVGCVLCLTAASFWASVGLGALCLSFAVVLLDERAFLIGGLLSSRMLGNLGRMSFSLYLWQQPFYKLMRYGAAPVWVMAPAAVLIGVASFRFVEQPARQAINDLFESRHARARVEGVLNET